MRKRGFGTALNSLTGLEVFQKSASTPAGYIYMKLYRMIVENLGKVKRLIPRASIYLEPL